MAHAEKCPICDGEGKYWPEGWCASEGANCYGCNGKGWVEVADGPYYTIQPLGPLYGAPNHTIHPWNDVPYCTETTQP